MSEITPDLPRDRTGLWPWLVAVTVPTLVFLSIISSGYDGKPYLRGDCPYYVAAAFSIAEDGDLDLGNQLWQPWQAHDTDIALDQRGRFVPKHPLWMSIAALPLLVIFGNPGALIFNILQLAALCTLMFFLARRVATPWAASIAVCLTAIFSFVPHYAWNFSPDIFTAVLLLAALAVLPKKSSPRVDRHILCGIFLGMATTIKPSFALAALALPLLIGRPLRRTIPAVALGVFLPVTVWMALNQHLFGNPMVTPYDRIVHFTPAGIELHSNREDFELPTWRTINNQLLMPAKGLLPTSPVTALSILLMPFLWKRNHRWAVYVAITSLLIFLFYTSYSQWVWSHWGNRFLMPLVVLGVLPLAAALAWRQPKIPLSQAPD